MKSYEFMRFSHPKLGRFVYKNKGSGIIIDNIFKPMKSIASSVFKNIVKPVAKKVLQSGILHAGEKLGKKVSEKSGDLIMKELANMTGKARATPTTTQMKTTTPKEEESTEMILNRLISGNGIKRRRKLCNIII